MDHQVSRIKIGLLFGEQSTEHEVSLQSAQNIYQAIDRERFDVLLIGIDKQGKWHISDENNYLSNPDNLARIALDGFISKRHYE